ncbi:hypothetical protein Mpsy_0631 [Methanolobus psychrophilus R15]|nr:hypothetical protein Mpsy_0631 [Methanolobus psychrophilus R15]
MDANEIDNGKNGIFSNYIGKRPDEIHYSIGIGLIEEKSRNYAATDIKNKFTQFKHYFENKYQDNKLCSIGYCVLIADKFSEKIKRELKVNKDNRLVYAHNKNKHFKIGNAPVFFVKREG